MILFNKTYQEIKERKNLLTFSIKQFLKENEDEKLGGTMKNINEQYVKDIPNFEEITKMNINSINNVFIIEFIESFFISEEGGALWNIINNIAEKHEEYTKDKFLNTAKKDSYEVLLKKLVYFVEYKLYYPNIEEFQIFVNFLKNFADFLLNELYAKKLIYFFPEKMFYKFKNLVKFLQNIIKSNSPFKEVLFDNDFDIKKNTFFNMIEINNPKKELILLTKDCLKQYITIIVKIIADKNIKKTIFKCELLNVLINLIPEEEYFNDNEISNIFNFVKEIHNNTEYKAYVNDFMKIFENKIITKDNTFTKLGKRLNYLFKIKENNDLLRNILTIIYSNMNTSLSKLEEIFAEYKFKPRANGLNNIQNPFLLNNNNANDNEDSNDDSDGMNLNTFSNMIGIPIIRQVMRNHPDTQIIRIGFRIVNPNRGRNIQQLSDKEKLEMLNDSLKDTNTQFVKLINFYKIAESISELYDFDSFENKYLNNLFVSLYNIVFSPSNSSKINDTNVINSHKRLIEIILKFYYTIFKNISFLNQEKTLKEFAKRRNLYHLKELSQSFNKLTEVKKDNKKDDKKSNNDIRVKYFNDFLSTLEKLVPEEETTKIININNTNVNSALKLDDKNICPICADSNIDTHILPCEHAICRNCLFQCLSGNKVCPFCRVQIKGIKEDQNFKI